MAPQRGVFRLLGPVGPSPYLNPGLLVDSWDQWPPSFSPYQPPYLTELVEQSAQRVAESRLFHLPVSPTTVGQPPPGVRLSPLSPDLLCSRWLPLLQEACQAVVSAPLPDEAEARFLLDWHGRESIFAWAAELDGRPVGFVLLQPDLGPPLRGLGGGRGLLQRVLAPLVFRRQPEAGRLLFGAVDPDHRGRGVGRLLLDQVLNEAHRRGWAHLAVGPLLAGSAGAAFLAAAGAEARQTYRLYRWQF